MFPPVDLSLSIDLKQWFRFNILEDSAVSDDDEKARTEKFENLQGRLHEFWHWRINLILILNKFGKSLGGQNNMILYHGTNDKMLIKVCDHSILLYISEISPKWPTFD